MDFDGPSQLGHCICLVLEGVDLRAHARVCWPDPRAQPRRVWGLEGPAGHIGDRLVVDLFGRRLE